MSVRGRESKREQLHLAREKQQREAKIRKIVGLTLVGVVTLALVAIVVFVAINRPSSTPVANGSKYLTSDGSYHILPSGAVDTKADESAKPGKVRVELFFDPQCPGCGAVARELDPQLMELMKKGEIDLFLKPISFLDGTSSDKYSSRAASAMITVANDDPENFFKFVSLLYATENQPHEANEYVPVSDEKLGELAQQAGVPKAVADTFKDRKYQQWVLSETERTAVRQDLFPNRSFSTPAVFVGGTVKDGVVSNATRVTFPLDTSISDSFNTALKKAKEGN